MAACGEILVSLDTHEPRRLVLDASWFTGPSKCLIIPAGKAHHCLPYFP